MRIFFIFIVCVHGLIHLLGFLKAFRLAEIEQLPPIPKPAGLLWLTAAILFLFVAVIFVIDKNWWWIPAVIAILLSQTMIIFVWHDAKAGTVANLIILIVAIFSFASWHFARDAAKDRDNLLSQGNAEKVNIVTTQQIEQLPTIVQKWMDQTGVVGKEEIHTLYFKQKGKMKLKPEQEKWYTAEAEQYVTIQKPGFIWTVDMKMMPLIHVAGKDIFQNGTGRMQMKIGSLIPVVNVKDNEKVDQSTLARFLLELVIYPSAAIQPYLTWEGIDETTAKATMSYKGVKASATFYFNQQAELIKVTAMRYKDSDEKAGLMECIAEIREYTSIDGIQIPTKIDISWMLETGKFTWYTLEISDVKLNKI